MPMSCVPLGKIALIGAILIGLGTATPASGAAGQSPESVTTTAAYKLTGWELAGDGRRFVSFPDESGNPVVLDTMSGELGSIDGADGCLPIDVASRRVLLDCNVGRYYTGTETIYETRGPRLASVTGGESYELLGTDPEDRPLALGKYWVRSIRICPSSWSGSSCSQLSPFAIRVSGGEKYYSNRHATLTTMFQDLDSNERGRIVKFPKLKRNE